MKRVVCLLLAAALLLGLLSGCQKTSPDVPLPQEYTALELVDAALLASGHDEEGTDLEYEYLTAEEGSREYLTAYLENAYGISSVELSWEDAAVIRATGASSFELAILRMEDEGAAVRAASSLMSYIFSRQGDFAGYAPDQADMVANGGIMQDGPYAGLFICPDPDRARAAVETAISGKGAVTDVKELRDLLVSCQEMEDADLEKLDDGDLEALNAYMKDTYGLTPDQWRECAIARGTGESAFEVAVVRVADVDGYWEVVDPLDSYLDTREGEFEGATDQARLLHQALTVYSKPYVVLLACQNAEYAAQEFATATGTGGYSYSARHPVWGDEDPDYPGRSEFIQPNKDDMSIYDTTAIRAAWEKGDPSGLSKEDQRIYNEAEKVLRKVLRDGMSDYEKEKAVYEWVVNNVNYDWTHQDVMKKTPRESFTPYGGLVNHTAVCLGYAATFQLLCDLTGVECITVVGAAFSSQEDHGWNMVRLNGKWYCLDATWDANYRESGRRRGQEYWSYFNVTSDYMADTDHQWDYANTPEATAADQGRG